MKLHKTNKGVCGLFTAAAVGANNGSCWHQLRLALSIFTAGEGERMCVFV